MRTTAAIFAVSPSPPIDPYLLQHFGTLPHVFSVAEGRAGLKNSQDLQCGVLICVCQVMIYTMVIISE